MKMAGTFARKLKQERLRLGLTKMDLARMVGRSCQNILYLERSEQDPRWTTVQLIAAALGISVLEFLDPDLVPKRMSSKKGE